MKARLSIPQFLTKSSDVRTRSHSGKSDGLIESEHVAAALQTQLVCGYLLWPAIFCVMLVASAHAVLPCRDGLERRGYTLSGVLSSSAPSDDVLQ